MMNLAIDDLLYELKNKKLPQKAYIIGIDGLGGSGKTTLAKLLKLKLHNDGYESYVLHIDEFINPKKVRYNNCKPQWYCYYNLQWRYNYLIEEILLPIKQNNKISKLIELYDKETDTYALESLDFSQGSILLLEGVFLQRKELKQYIDFIIYIDISKKLRLQRVLERDSYIGSSEDIKEKYKKRYFLAEERYILDYSPI